MKTIFSIFSFNMLIRYFKDILWVFKSPLEIFSNGILLIAPGSRSISTASTITSISGFKFKILPM